MSNPRNFEEQALSMIGKELYEAFFRGYTRKQWGVNPTDLPASILKRLPLRFIYDDNYFNHPFQGTPESVYTSIIENIVDFDGIDIMLGKKFEEYSDVVDHIFYTGPIDRYFNFSHGRLGYRTLDFERGEADGDFQGTAVINYSDENVPYTRISEHKHFAPWEADSFNKTVYFREYSRLAGVDDIPYYPIILSNEVKMLGDYISSAENSENVSFWGRLGTYRYLDMDVTINEALSACHIIDECVGQGKSIPPFFVDARV